MSIPAWAVRGAKVVCVNDDEGAFTAGYAGPLTHGLDGLAKGSVYTIRDVFLAANGRTCLRLVEIRRPIDGPNAVFFPNIEGGFDIRRFRPAVESKSEAEDLALFKHHLREAVRA